MYYNNVKINSGAIKYRDYMLKGEYWTDLVLRPATNIECSLPGTLSIWSLHLNNIEIDWKSRDKRGNKVDLYLPIYFQKDLISHK
jgi:hypothetical protein